MNLFTNIHNIAIRATELLLSCEYGNQGVPDQIHPNNDADFGFDAAAVPSH